MTQTNTQGSEIKEATGDNKETVVVNKEIFDSILSELKLLKKKTDEIESTSDRDQIARIEKLRSDGHLASSVKVSMYNNKYVISWNSVKDDVYVDSNGKEQSIQETELTYLDKKKETVNQRDFSRKRTYKSLEVIRESKEKDGQLYFTMIDESGNEIFISSLFVN